jgi:hypothetical protein
LHGRVKELLEQIADVDRCVIYMLEGGLVMVVTVYLELSERTKKPEK